MEQKPSARIERIGVTRTELAVREQLGWLFREQPTEDFGIDAHIEVVDGTSVRGRLLGVQIKSGESYFDEPGADGWWFRPYRKHVEYWLRHSLPVVVVLYHPILNQCYWALVTKDTLTESRAGNPKLWVPAAHVLDAASVEPLRAAAEGDAYELRLRELRLALPWMRRLAEGQRLVVDIEEWINKTSGRGRITLGIDHELGDDPEPLADWGVMLGPASYAEVIPQLFAWADVGLHEETYSAYEDEGLSESFLYDEESVSFAYDEETGQLVQERFDDWRATIRQTGLRPYKNGAGEVDFWRLELTLNALGRAYLEVDRFAATGERQLTPS